MLQKMTRVLRTCWKAYFTYLCIWCKIGIPLAHESAVWWPTIEIHCRWVQTSRYRPVSVSLWFHHTSGWLLLYGYERCLWYWYKISLPTGETQKRIEMYFFKPIREREFFHENNGNNRRDSERNNRLKYVWFSIRFSIQFSIRLSDINLKKESGNQTPNVA